MNLSYRNPVWPGYAADPFVLRHGDFYYAYATFSPADEGREGLKTGPLDGRHFALLRSRDLTAWEPLGGALEPVPEFAGEEHWAPEVAYANGKFWMYYSTDQRWNDMKLQRLRVAVADGPEGPFRDVGKLLLPDEGFTIDASPYQDPSDGTWYLFFAKDFLDGRAGTGVAVVPLAEDMISIVGEPRVVVRATADWQISGRNRRMYGNRIPLWHTVEGPQVVKRGGVYFCFYSGGNWQRPDYGVSFATAPHPLGPWTDSASAEGPAVLMGVPGKVRGPGHNSLTLAPDGETLMCVYHAWDETLTVRQLCVDPVVWTEDGPKVTPSWEEVPVPV